MVGSSKGRLQRASEPPLFIDQILMGKRDREDITAEEATNEVLLLVRGLAGPSTISQIRELSLGCLWWQDAFAESSMSIGLDCAGKVKDGAGVTTINSED
ncbi:diguanylate cyclase [Striga asiatica]|uniref:Diguanylate cyclase n=1 Tax=Striga asiatica TaxID=4170 RepID=A0A5A7QBF2_STRAF|nr:diguanylate cyclase [Striga asiatica]